MPDPDAVHLRPVASLTREEIAAEWRRRTRTALVAGKCQQWVAFTAEERVAIARLTRTISSPGREPMKLIDTFTREEVVAALLLVLPREHAEEEADIMLTPIDTVDERGISWFPPDYEGDPRLYSEGLLDLLSLVSDETAFKAWTLLGVSREEGTTRRERLRQRLSTEP